MQSQNPATGETEHVFEYHSDEVVEVILSNAFDAYQTLRSWTFEKRAEHMREAAQIMRSEAAILGEIVTSEMGKTLKSAIAEVEKSALCADFYADHAEAMLADEPITADVRSTFRKYLPIGPVLAIMPWNYPIWQVIRFAAPALMAGNSGLLKHASNVPQCALYIEDIFNRAGFPDGAFSTLLIKVSQVEGILRDNRIRAATLTGSETAGAAVASICGNVIKPTILELGGSDAFIIMPSADLDQAVQAGTLSRTMNNGQSCIAAKRFVVHEDVYEVVKAKFIDAFSALNVGDPKLDQTDVGPLVDEKSRREIQRQVETAVNEGADILVGCDALSGPGSFMTPGILENIPLTSSIFHEEIFGPVAALYKVSSIEEAVSLANDSPFGLSSSVWTTDPAEQAAAIKGIDTGATFINSMSASDPRVPFGGAKRSGYGRELSSEGIRAFCNLKTVSIA